jgi:predicted outer membrane repeat protein
VEDKKMARVANSRIQWIISILVVVLATLNTTAVGKTIYVDADVPGANDGSSWANAYDHLQDALVDANSAEKPVEIWVAQGSYAPDQGAGTTPGDREATFQLVDGVILKGGFAGFGEPNPDTRDIDRYTTVLSGDLNGNDADVDDPSELRNESTRAENNYHVVTGSGTNETAVLDGFLITGGNAPAGYLQRNGGGMYNESCSATVLNCTFMSNSAYIGGGMHNENSSPTLINCTFTRNLATAHGGGLHNRPDCFPKLSNCIFAANLSFSGRGGGISGGRMTLDDCTFKGNSARYEGGGLTCYRTTLRNCTFIGNATAHYGGAISTGVSPLIDCTFDENSAENGGAIYNGAKTVLEGCTFRGNWANDGGAIFNDQSDLTIDCCIFKGNSADYGGGIENCNGAVCRLTNCVFAVNEAHVQGGVVFNGWRRGGTNAMLTNCTFAGNSAPNGNAMACDSYQQEYPSRVELINCILWDGGDEISNNDGSTITINYGNIQGGWPGKGNIDADPLFVDPNNGDYHLASKRGRYWPEHNIWVLDKVTSPCIDSGDPDADYLNEPIPNGGRINMGAYGGTPYASMSEEQPFSADVNNDGVVDTDDLLMLFQWWLEAAGY